MMEMAGLAQKGGAVHIHVRLANKPSDITAVRVATGEADALIGGDLVVSAGAKTLGLTSSGRTGAVINSHEIITGEFTRHTEFTIPTDRLELQLEARLRDRLSLFDASELARVTLGDSIYSNMMVFGGAWQMGLLPITHASITDAIRLNGTAIEGNLRAFEIGRWAVAHPEDAARLIVPSVTALPKTLEEKIAFRADHLKDYQGRGLARRYRELVESVSDTALREAVAKGYHKLLAYKDEYEVARLHQKTREKAAEQFEGDFRMSYHLAPPVFAKDGPGGRPVKKQYGPGMGKWLKLLTKMKRLRGTPFDPFGRTEERKMERALIKQYEADMAEWLPKVEAGNMALIRELAELPLTIRGFGPVKLANAKKAAARRMAIQAELRGEAAPAAQAAE